MKVHVGMSHGFMVLLLVMISIYCTEGRAQAMEQQLNVRLNEKRLNKPIVKSIKSPDGDIIDCVHIYHQPAFDHPLLKNHTIQMRPSSDPFGLYDKNKEASKQETSSIPQLWHQNGRCPEDTIPIRRTNKDDVLRANSIIRYGKTIPNPTSTEPDQLSITKSEYAAVYVKGDKYYGAKATINIWNPKIGMPEESSSSQFWLVGDNAGQFNMLEVGWHVYPALYRDNKTRLFIFWTSDRRFKNACWNLNCPGFVQTNSDIALGSIFNNISSYGGRQFDVTLYIWKEQKTGNWWLQFENLYPLGYWPSSLVPVLSSGANLVQWGGEVAHNNQIGQHTTTEMGSGHLSGEGFRNASYIKNIRVVDYFNTPKVPKGIDAIGPDVVCYDVIFFDEWGDHFYYGGPGKNSYCS